jgi:hypothetical protein
MGTSQAHLHVSLFGIEFTLPVEQDDDDSDEGQPTHLIAAAPTIALAPSPSHFIAWTLPILDFGEPVPIAPTFRCKTAVAAPLCDTARHERSGVQLI